MADNTVTLCGNLTREPEFVQTSTGTALVRASMATNHRKQVGGKWEDEPSYFDLVLFGDQAMNVLESLHQGDRVMVTGRLKWSSWEKDGQKRSKIEVVVDEIGPSLRWAQAQPTKVTLGKSTAAHIGTAKKALEDAAPSHEWALGEEPF